MLQYNEQVEIVQRQLAKMTWCPASLLATVQTSGQVCELQQYQKILSIARATLESLPRHYIAR